MSDQEEVVKGGLHIGRSYGWISLPSSDKLELCPGFLLGSFIVLEILVKKLVITITVKMKTSKSVSVRLTNRLIFLLVACSLGITRGRLMTWWLKSWIGCIRSSPMLITFEAAAAAAAAAALSLSLSLLSVSVSYKLGFVLRTSITL